MKDENINEFKIFKDVSLGFYCEGGDESACGEAMLVLTNEELDALVALIKKKGTADIDELELDEEMPEVYAKLDAGCLAAARVAEEDYWLEYGWEDPDCFNPEDAMEKVEKEYGYKFEYKEEDFRDKDGNVDESEIEDAKLEHFTEWATNYKDSLRDDEERRKFMRLFVSVDVSDVDYEVEIPEEIVWMCDLDDDE